MPQTGLASLLAEVFAAQGWRTTQDAALEGRSGTVYGAPVLVETEGLVVLVERRGRDDRVRAGLIAEMQRVVADTGADIGLLAYLGDIDDDARHAASDPQVAQRIVLWDKTLLTLLVGSTRLAHATGTPLPTLPLEHAPLAPPRAWFDEPPAPTGDFAAPWDPAPARGQAVPAPHEAMREMAPRQPTPRELAWHEAGPTPHEGAPHPDTSPHGAHQSATDFGDVLPPAFQDVDLGALERVGGLDSFFDAEPASGPRVGLLPDPWASATPAPPPPAPTPTMHPALPPRIRQEKAAQMVQDRLFGVRGAAELVLQPVHLFDYECDLLTEGSLRYDTVAGRVEVHGTTKDVRDVDPVWIDPAKAGPLPTDLQVPVDQRVLRVSDALAAQLAHEALLKAHSRIVQIESADEEDDVIVMERRDVSPRPDQVRVQPRGVVLRPFWRLRGGNGACLVDAITGEVVGEQLRTYDPDAMVIE